MSVPSVPRRGAEVPLWLVHPPGGAREPDRYEVVFDFAAFAEACRGPTPRLVAWTGTGAVDPLGLRQTLRRVIASEFDAARLQLEALHRGEAPPVSAMGALAGLAVQGASVILRLNPVGFALGAIVTIASLAIGDPQEEAAPEADRDRLEAEIARLTAAADRALNDVALRVHPDLRDRAGATEPAEEEAWPLPPPVTRAMEER